MTELVLDVGRPDDMLQLRFSFRNLDLGADDGQPRRLIRADPDQAAIIIVTFPPQHVAEQCFPDFSGSLGGLPETDRRIGAYISGESRLAFRLPADQNHLSLTLESLLDWSGMQPILWRENADGSDSAGDDEEFGIRMPQDFHTAIELPYRLTLSPDATGQWQHRTSIFAGQAGAAELWHTRLAQTGDPAMRLWAIWSPDHPDFNPLPDPFLSSLKAEERSEIVQLSADRELLSWSRFEGINEQQLAEDQRARLEAARARLGRPIGVRSCMLSSLGGYLDVATRFDFPTLGSDLVSHLRGHEMDQSADLFSLGEWSHLSTMGRDQYVRTLHHGYLLPFGHRADLVTITERRFTLAQPVPNGERPAYLAQHDVLVVHDPHCAYSHHDLPFTAVDVAELVSPPLDPRITGRPLSIGGSDYLMPLTAIDRDGLPHSFGAPVIFVPDNDPAALAEALFAYANDPTIGRAAMGGSAVAFAPRSTVAQRASEGLRDDISEDPIFTRLETIALDLLPIPAGGFPPVLPRMASATVKLPVVGELGGAVSASGAKISYHPDYAIGGFERAAQGIFARVEAASISFPADRGGGVASPSFAISGLSRVIGAISNVEAVAKADFNPAAELALAEKTIIEGLGGKLLGVIDLARIVAPAELVDHLPKLDTRVVPGGREFSFRWNPKCHIGNELPSPLTIIDGSGGDAPALAMTGTVFVPIADGAPPPHQAIDGALANFSLVFADVLGVTFKEVGFHSQTGARTRFDVKIAGITFTGDLSFVQDLTDILNSIGLGDSVRPTITPAGDHIMVGMTITLPDATMGVLTLSNIAVLSSVTLYFSEKPAEVTFGLSSEANPFLVAYTIFGGGGFFQLTSRTNGDIAVAAGFQFGAMAALNLVVLKGSAQIMVGFKFSTAGKSAVFAGYVRIFGSLEILGIVTISVDFSLTLALSDGVATGTARVTIMVRLLIFSKSVSFSVSRSFSPGAGLGGRLAAPANRFVDMMSPADWQEYCAAFA